MTLHARFGVFAGIVLLLAVGFSCRSIIQTQPPASNSAKTTASRNEALQAEAKAAQAQGTQLVRELRQNSDSTERLPASEPAAAAPPAPVVLSNRIFMVADKLSVQVWMNDKISQLSGFPFDAEVSDSGDVFLPHVGIVRVIGRSAEDIQRELQARFALLVRGASVIVLLRRERGVVADVLAAPQTVPHFIVLGRVKKPGVFPLAPGLTLREGIAMASGFERYANGNIFLVRGSREHPEVLRVDLYDILKGSDLSRNMELTANDAIYVAPTFIWKVADFVSTLMMPVVSVRDAFWVYDRVSGD